ncbi:MAG: extracellular solute-binding protein [Clostridiales bacterium]|nr:extracellular solute-binding protein [Clostridiales bacterium]
MKTKRNITKLMLILLCMLLVISSLAACGKDVKDDTAKGGKPSGTEKGSDKKDDKEPSAEGGYSGSAPVTEEEKTFTILTTNSGSKLSTSSDWEKMTWWHEALERANINLELEIIDSSAYGDVVRPRLAAAADLPDAIKLPDKDPDMSYLNSGIFIELSDLIDEYGYNLSKQFEIYDSLKAEVTTPDGEIYYLPYIYTPHNNSRTLMVNDAFAEKVGKPLSEMKTLDDYYDYLVAVKEADANENGNPDDEIPLFMRAGMTKLWGMVWGLDLSDGGGYQADENGNIICGYIDDRYLEMLTFFNKLYTEGLLYNEFATADLDTQNALFADNQVGSLIHFVSNCTGYSQRIDPDWNIDTDELIIVPVEPLEGPHGDKYAYGRDVLGSIYGITTECEDPETLFAFFDYLYSEEIGILTWYGLEGKDYEVSNGDYVFSDEFLDNKDNYRGVNGFNFDGLPSYQFPGGYMATQSDKVRDISENVLNKHLMNPTVTFSYKLDSENEIIQEYAADLATYFDENLTAFIMGTKPLSEWDSYVETVKSMHVDDIIEVHQAVYDRQSAVE